MRMATTGLQFPEVNRKKTLNDEVVTGLRTTRQIKAGQSCTPRQLAAASRYSSVNVGLKGNVVPPGPHGLSA